MYWAAEGKSDPLPDDDCRGVAGAVSPPDEARAKWLPLCFRLTLVHCGAVRGRLDSFRGPQCVVFEEMGTKGGEKKPCGQTKRLSCWESHV
jgi:hypothetical protein